MDYEEKLEIQAKEVLSAYQDFFNVLIYFDCFEKEDFINNQIVLDTASMFIQRVTNASLGKEISHFITPSEIRIGNIRNDLSHGAKKYNDEQIYDICLHYFNQEATIEHSSKQKIEINDFDEKKDFTIKKQKEEFIKDIARKDPKNLMLSKALINLSRLKHYLKTEEIKSSNLSKNSIIYNAVCFNIMSAREHLKLSSLKSNKEFYSKYENLQDARNKIAHEFESLKISEIFLAIEDLIKITKQECRDKINKKENKELNFNNNSNNERIGV